MEEERVDCQIPITRKKTQKKNIHGRTIANQRKTRRGRDSLRLKTKNCERANRGKRSPRNFGGALVGAGGKRRGNEGSVSLIVNEEYRKVKESWS